MKHLIVGDLDVAYEVAGKGPAVLLLHGWGSNAQTYDGLAVALQKNFQTIRLDLPGFGSSQTPNETWTLDEYVDFLESFLHKLKIQKLHGLIGHSLGGRLSIRAQSTHRLMSDKLVLLASHGIASPHSPRLMFYRLAGKLAKFAIALLPKRKQRLIRERAYTRIGSTDYMNTSPAMKGTFQNIINQDLRDDAGKVQTPALLIYGSDDTVTPAKFGQQFADRMPNAKLVVVDGAEHYVHNDQPGQVHKLVRDFL